MNILLGNGKKSRLLWNNGKEICWTHIKKLVDDELSKGLKLIPKLTMAHVDLNPYSIMRVNLACQVLSKSVSNVIFLIIRKKCMPQQNFAIIWTVYLIA